MPINKKAVAVAAVLLAVALYPQKSWACACGCGLFDVSTNTLYPEGAGGTASLEYNYMNQTDNFNGGHNHDKRVTSTVVTPGVQYMFDRTWGLSLRMPLMARSVVEGHHGEPDAGNEAFGFGDVRISGVYTGLSADMSTGLEFGLKLPTGDYSDDRFERDAQLGSGSADLVLGAYKRGYFGKSPYSWFVRGAFSQPLLTQDSYRPGSEMNAAVGGAHSPVDIGGIKVAPVLQLVGTLRWRDGGSNGDADNTGYERVMITPGLEFSLNKDARVYTDVGLPVYQHVRGEQLVAPAYAKLVISRAF